MGRFRNNLCNSLKQPKDLEFMLKLFSFSFALPQEPKIKDGSSVQS